MLMIVQNISIEISKELEGLPGIGRVVLGGARASGNHHTTSAIGIYYDESVRRG